MPILPWLTYACQTVVIKEILDFNLLLGFLTPLYVEAEQDGPTLPSKSSEEFRPFVHRLPEFKFW